MRRFALSFAALAALSACASGPDPARSLTDPVVQRLYALPTAEFYAHFEVAAQIAAACGRYRYDTALQEVLTRSRIAQEGPGSLQKARDGIVLYSDVLMREFQARHNAAIGRDDVCAGADAEYAAGTPLSAALVPTRG